MYRRTRFVCVSDTHGYTPSEAGFKLPVGDVLIHAGDLTNHGGKSELRKTMAWIAAADFEVKIVICGNHDVTLDASFYTSHGPKFHREHLEDPQECLQTITQASPSIVFLRHQSALVRLTRPNGPNTIFKVFGSPYSPQSSPGTWAFGYEPSSEAAAALWDSIPLDADLVVTHTPPHSHCDDRVAGGPPVGCEALHRALGRVRPMLMVCGHVHQSRGCERVRWDQSEDESSASPLPLPSLPLPSATRDKDKDTDRVVKATLPPLGSKKQSLVDLTGRKAPRLANEGLAGDISATLFSSSSQNALLLPSPPQSLPPLSSPEATAVNTETPIKPHNTAQPSHPRSTSTSPQSNNPPRDETCIINAAILATSWPHHGGKRFHSPIVVDLDLPVWTTPV